MPRVAGFFRFLLTGTSTHEGDATPSLLFRVAHRLALASFIVALVYSSLLAFSWNQRHFDHDGFAVGPVRFNALVGTVYIYSEDQGAFPFLNGILALDTTELYGAHTLSWFHQYRAEKLKHTVTGEITEFWTLALYPTCAPLCLLWPLLWFPFLLLRRRRVMRNITGRVCSACGYDLRASPTICPECGKPVIAFTSSRV